MFDPSEVAELAVSDAARDGYRRFVSTRPVRTDDVSLERTVCGAALARASQHNAAAEGGGASGAAADTTVAVRWAFLSLSWAIIADIDIGSDAYRVLGPCCNVACQSWNVCNVSVTRTACSCHHCFFVVVEISSGLAPSARRRERSHGAGGESDAVRHGDVAILPLGGR